MNTMSFRFAGFGGQGVLLMGMMLTYAGMEEGKHVTWLPSYGAEMRGGTANCTVVVSDDEVASPVAESPDVVVVMNEPSLEKFEPLVRPGGWLFINSSLVKKAVKRTDVQVVSIDATNIAYELKNARTANMVMLGAVVGRTGTVQLSVVESSLLPVLGTSKKALVEINIQALRRGREIAKG
ncbi:2-oxoacid:ferredoxin oxidoreductase subunit gamma [Candidatus Wirthbacteria bacterium CG2_30_54_11]|uniref:2-oxoacid:ferredoxin oxidoreductase subunit gamma n=1 Tax=Candidatus Wirthbacteria bacterium CG2_30_54_11 TaxID=1817892 RepID=A0A1J5IXK6_9BACT|nr:MAG: 2-oxoacid:ferredoxin oxidoreductase subunit gamma [Candidatus Wirthbacteria bacterium CG2_30_54_11]